MTTLLFPLRRGTETPEFVTRLDAVQEMPMVQANLADPHATAVSVVAAARQSNTRHVMLDKVYELFGAETRSDHVLRWGAWITEFVFAMQEETVDYRLESLLLDHPEDPERRDEDMIQFYESMLQMLQFVNNPDHHQNGEPRTFTAQYGVPSSSMSAYKMPFQDMGTLTSPDPRMYWINFPGHFAGKEEKMSVFTTYEEFLAGLSIGLSCHMPRIVLWHENPTRDFDETHLENVSKDVERFLPNKAKSEMPWYVKKTGESFPDFISRMATFTKTATRET